MPTAPSPILAARVPAEIAVAFEALAAREDRTVSQELRRVIREYVVTNAMQTPKDGTQPVRRLVGGAPNP